MFTIDEIIRRYNDAKAAEAAAKKEAAALKDLIIEFAKGRKTFDTDLYNVIIKETVTTRLDSAALYKDFPDIKKEYGKESVSVSIAAAPKATEKKTA